MKLILWITFFLVISFVLGMTGITFKSTYWQNTTPFYIGWFGCMLFDFLKKYKKKTDVPGNLL